MRVSIIPAIILLSLGLTLLAAVAATVGLLLKSLYQLARGRFSEAAESFGSSLIGVLFSGAYLWVYLWLFDRWVTTI